MHTLFMKSQSNLLLIDFQLEELEIDFWQPASPSQLLQANEPLLHSSYLHISTLVQTWQHLRLLKIRLAFWSNSVHQSKFNNTALYMRTELWMLHVYKCKHSFKTIGRVCIKSAVNTPTETLTGCRMVAPRFMQLWSMVSWCRLICCQDTLKVSRLLTRWEGVGAVIFVTGWFCFFINSIHYEWLG